MKTTTIEMPATTADLTEWLESVGLSLGVTESTLTFESGAATVLHGDEMLGLFADKNQAVVMALGYCAMCRLQEKEEQELAASGADTGKAQT